MKNKTGESYDAKTITFIVAYGVKGHQNDVDFRIWDRFYYIENIVVNYETAIDMKNHQIKGLSDGNEDSDVVNVKQLNELETNGANYVKSEIAKVNSEISKEIPIKN